ncbi:MAG: HPr family phosphocarrier protein [Eubacterium sp.]|jgi:Phosphotransferase System HPr (HPr) Family|nr:HPr family phosphocarrier protein [Eubacterium sp.]
MSSKQIVVSDVTKAHKNPIAELVQVACQFDCRITLESGTRKINAKSIMGIMAFNPSNGMEVNIIADGNDEQEAVEAVEKFLICV